MGKAREAKQAGARSLATQVSKLTHRCDTLEREVHLLTFEERIRQLSRRVTTLEQSDDNNAA